MYADQISDAMNTAIKETERRRNIQEKYNKEHGIIPKTIVKDIKEIISNQINTSKQKMNKKEMTNMIDKLEIEMKNAAKNLDFERAMELRDIIFEIKGEK